MASERIVSFKRPVKLKSKRGEKTIKSNGIFIWVSLVDPKKVDLGSRSEGRNEAKLGVGGARGNLAFYFKTPANRVPGKMNASLEARNSLRSLSWKSEEHI